MTEMREVEMLALMNVVEKLVARVIAQAEHYPADAVLRQELKSAKVTRQESGAIADLVFTYFRWRGWLDAGDNLAAQLRLVRELDHRFATALDTFSTEELIKAIPSWTVDEVAVSREWLVTLQTRPTLWLRAKRGTGRELTRALGQCKPASRELSDALEYTGSQDLFRTPEFHAGEFEVQDIASQLVGLHCDPKPGETWWDACAGEGGKTLHLADLMKNKGLIWASDRSERRMANLKRRAARAKVFNYRAAPWDGSAKLPTKTKFDGVLIDGPCSGVGTWQRNPHARWSTTMEDVGEMAAIQQQLVLNAAAAVKPGGKLIYAVCTLTRAETQAVADLCSPRLSGFAPFPLPASTNEPPAALGQKWVWPHHFRGNGMFVAEWKRLL
jgi:16S rRNA (cytosine967-C5)-methyltransferase